MKKGQLTQLFVFCSLFSFAQPGEWTWLKGDSVLNGSGSYGVQGVPSSTNLPVAVYEASEWTDLAGNFWMFGGNDNTGAMYADLWRYNPGANEWTWMKGPGAGGFLGVFGTQGISSPANNPRSGIAFATWVDSQGNFWLFGGSYSGVYNTLWKYDISTNEWTWMKGTTISNDPGTYGVQGVPSPLNNPAGRYECVTTWVDLNGDFWLFGGYSSPEIYNDLWRYSIATNEWTWMKGSSLPNQPGFNGVMGVEDPANVPASRLCYAHWTDPTGNLWFYGGVNLQSNLNYDDMWKYNPLTNNWTWMGGTINGNTQGHYGTKCIADSLNHPGGRWENRASWTDNNGNFWFFGGELIYGSQSSKNDLWMYCLATNKWIWASGDSTDNPLGLWGTQGVSNPLNKPDGRWGSVGWKDAAGNLCLFGGVRTTPIFGRSNDLWKYSIDYTCVPCSSMPSALFNSDNHICPGACITFNNMSTTATSFVWSFPGATPNTSTDVNPSGICYPTPGSYDVQLIATNANGSDTLTLQNYITVYPFPSPQGILQSGDTLFAIAGSASYQWYYNGSIITGATDYFYIATASGDYNVIATDMNGCEVEAVINNVMASSHPDSYRDPDSGSQFIIFPNPVEDKFTIHDSQFMMGTDNTEISIYNVFGEKIHLAVNCCPWTVDCRQLTSGMYYIEINKDYKIFRGKFLKSTYR